MNAKSFKKEFAKRLKEARLDCEWSQGNLSNAAKVSRVYISEMERGKKVPTATVLYALCKALEVSADKLLGL